MVKQGTKKVIVERQLDNTNFYSVPNFTPQPNVPKIEESEFLLSHIFDRNNSRYTNSVYDVKSSEIL